MGIFISYSSRDRPALEDLLFALKRAREEIWFDEELGGGEEWWRIILDRIRSCEVFVFALSLNSLQSKPCLAELRYAQDLGKAILPIQIGPVESMRLTPLATVEVIDYQNPTVDTGIQLITAIREARDRQSPLPSPLPAEPPVPFAYLMRLATTITGQEISPRDQTLLLSELRAGIEEDGDDPAALADITRLLTTLRDRPDVTYRTRTDIDALLTSHSHPASSPINAAVQSLSKPTAPPRTPKMKWAVAAAAIAGIVGVGAFLLSATKTGTPLENNSTAAPTTGNPDVTVIVDGRRLDTTGRPMCVSISGRSSISIAAPDAASQVIVTMTGGDVDAVTVPIDGSIFSVGGGYGKATAKKTGESTWSISGELWGMQTATAQEKTSRFLIDVTCP